MELDEQQTQHALTVLTRLAQRDPMGEHALTAALVRDIDRTAPLALRVAMETGDPMARLLAASLQQSTPSTTTLLELADKVPTPNRPDPINELGIVIDQLLVPKVGDDPLHAVALWLDQARRHLEGERFDEAIAAVQSAAGLADRVPAGDRPLAEMETARCLADVLERQGHLEQSVTSRSQALNIARRNLDSKSDPRIARLLTTRGDQYRLLGRYREAAHDLTDAARLWDQVLHRGDLDRDLVASRLREQPADEAERLHITVNSWRTDLWGGARLGRYRINTVMASYHGLVTTLAPGRPAAEATFCAVWAGLCWLLDGQVARAVRMLVDGHRRTLQLKPEDASLGIHVAARSYLAVALWCARRRSEAIDALVADAASSRDRPSGPPKFDDDDLAEIGTLLALPLSAERSGGSSRAVRTYVKAAVDLAAQLGAENDLLLFTLLDRGIELKDTGHADQAAPLLEQLAIVGQERQLWQLGVPALVACSNAYARAGDGRKALSAAGAGIRALETPGMAARLGVFAVAATYHAYARRLAEGGRTAEAVVAENSALAAMAPDVERGDVQVATECVNLLDFYTSLTERDDKTIEMPAPLRTLTAQLLSLVQPQDEEEIRRLMTLAFVAVSAAARDPAPAETVSLHKALVAFDERHDSGCFGHKVRSVVCWNVMTCLIDANCPAATVWPVLDEVATLARGACGQGDPSFTVEHGKCAAEWMAYLWNTGRETDAAEVAVAHDDGLRAPGYLADRQRANGQSAADFLDVLNHVVGYAQPAADDHPAED